MALSKRLGVGTGWRVKMQLWLWWAQAECRWMPKKGLGWLCTMVLFDEVWGSGGCSRPSAGAGGGQSRDFPF